MKLGGVDATSQLRKRLSRYDPVYLKTVCVGTSLVDQAAALVEDTVANNEWTDVTVSVCYMKKSRVLFDVTFLYVFRLCSLLLSVMTT